MEVSVLGFGCWPVGNEWTEADDQSSKETIKEAIELGINFFDVAPVYGLGHAEKILGEAIKGHRNNIFIASKCGLRWDNSGNIKNNLSRESILEEIDNSLRRLDTDYLDLYQIHWPDPNTPIEETMEIFNELRQKGKIRNIGVSNFSMFLIERARKFGEIVSNQVLYNMIDRDSDHYHDLPLTYRTESEIFPYCQKNNIGVIPYSPLEQGLLTDDFEIEKLENGDVRCVNPELRGEKLKENLRIANKLQNIARDLDKPLVQLVLNWLFSKEAISTIIVGATNIRQVKENVGALDWKLESGTIKKINSILNKNNNN